jgi:serine/threonine protein kinase
MSVIGLRVGPFEIVREAAMPGPGPWYLAARAGMTSRQPAEVLVRLLPPDAAPAERAALQHEFEVLRSIDDPRIPGTVAIYEGIGALAVSALQGQPLQHLVDDRRLGAVPMTPATLLDIGLELAEALQHVHHKGWVHGNLSPEMVLVGPEGKLSIWGFGAPPPTAIGPWTPPERARQTGLAASTDQWSLGAMLAALITGQPPWRAEDPGAEARRGDPAKIVEPIETQWPALGRLLRKMLDPDPDNRFPALSPLRQELLALSRKAGGTSERPKLGAMLSRRTGPVPAQPTWNPDDAEPTPPIRATNPEPAPVPEPPRAAEPAAPPPEPQIAAPQLISPPTPVPARPRKPDLPSEPMAVVRVDSIDDDMPVARTPATPAPAAPRPSGPGRVVAVLDEDSPSSVPMPRSIARRKSIEIDEEEQTGSEEQTTLFSNAALEAAIAAAGGAPAKAGKDPVDPPTLPDFAERTPPPAEPPERTDDPVSDATVVFNPNAFDMAELKSATAVFDGDRPTAVPAEDGSDPDLADADLASDAGPPTSDPPSGPSDVLPAGPTPTLDLPPPDDAPIKRIAPWLAIAMLIGLTILLLWKLLT